MGEMSLDLDGLLSPRRQVSGIECVRSWCDGLQVREPVAVTIYLDQDPIDGPRVSVYFVARSHVHGEGGDDALEFASDASETFASGRDPVLVAHRLASRIQLLQPGEGVDVWVGAAGELSAHVLALVFSAAAFLGRSKIGGRAYDLEIAVSEMGVAEDAGGPDPDSAIH